MANLVTRSFSINNTWTAPAGVKKVKVKSYQVIAPPLSIGLNGYGLSAYGDCFAWGANGNGQIGDGTVVAKSSPVLVSGQLRFKQISTANDHALGLTEDGLVYAWGLNDVGQLGTGSQVPTSVPSLVTGGRRFKQVSAGRGSVSMALSTEGFAYAWGANGFGQLGDGTVADKSSPVLVLGGIKFQKISSGFNNAGGLTPAGAAYAWGDGQFGQLGNGTNSVAASSPLLVSGGLTFRDISVGASTFAAITTADDLYMWGFGNYGQTGHGNRLDVSSPVIVVGGKAWSKVSASNSGLTGSTLAIDTAGAAYAWGYNGQAQLGDGTVADKSSPVLVLGGKTWVHAQAGGLACIGMDELGDFYAWGFNQSGQLGLGNNTQQSSPVLVIGAKPWRSIKNQLFNQEVVTVTPGTSYAITVTGPVVAFGTKTFLQASFGQCMVVLEYFM